MSFYVLPSLALNVVFQGAVACYNHLWNIVVYAACYHGEVISLTCRVDPNLRPCEVQQLINHKLAMHAHSI